MEAGIFIFILDRFKMDDRLISVVFYIDESINMVSDPGHAYKTWLSRENKKNALFLHMKKQKKLINDK